MPEKTSTKTSVPGGALVSSTTSVVRTRELPSNTIVVAPPVSPSSTVGSFDPLSPLAPLARVSTTLPMVRDVSPQEVVDAISVKASNIADLSVPMYIDNKLPQPAPDSPIVFQSALVGGVQVVTIQDQVVQMQDNAGVTMSISAVDDAGEIVAVNTSGAIIIELDSSISIVGEGFLPNSDVVVWLFSSPTRLGVFKSDSEGRLNKRVLIPQGMALGGHTIQINAHGSDSTIRSLNLAVELREPNTTPAEATLVDQSQPETEIIDRQVASANKDSRDLILRILIVIIVLLILVNANGRRRSRG